MMKLVNESYGEFLKNRLFEDFYKKYDEWNTLLKKHGYEEEPWDYEYRWHKKYDTGVVVVSVDSGNTREDYYWSVVYIPYVKVEPKFFGLIKKRIAPKSTNIALGHFDFGTGLFVKDDEEVLNNFDRLLSTVDKRVSKIKDEWLPPFPGQDPWKIEFWKRMVTKRYSGMHPSKLLYKDPKDYTDKALGFWKD